MNIRHMSKIAVLRLLADSPRSRAELQRLSGLSRTTVSSVVAELIQEGRVIEIGFRRHGRRARGRPPSVLTVVPPPRWVAGIDFEHRSLLCRVENPNTAQAAEVYVQREIDGDAKAALDVAAACLLKLTARLGISLRDIGCGVATVPAPVDVQTGRVWLGNILPGWAGLRAGAELEARTGVRFVVENDANLAAVGELVVGAGRGIRNLLYVKVSTGIGAAVVLDGSVIRGSNGLAGEIGHIQADPHGNICRCGARGCLETVVAVPHILAMLRAARPQVRSAADVDALVREGDAASCRAVIEAGRMIGRVLADMVNMLNPELVIIGGDFEDSLKVLVEGVREAVARFTQPATSSYLRVVHGVLGRRAEITGSILRARALLVDERSSDAALPLRVVQKGILLV